MSERSRIEWPTLGLIGLVYGIWAVALVWLPVWGAIPVLALVIALHSSLCHEALHGHPTATAWLNAALVFPALGLCVPYLRFKDTHLAHHQDSRLTDPYDDPESNYLDPAVWRALPRWRQILHRINNTLAGRLLLGPIMGQIGFMAADFRLIRGGDMRVLWEWLLHIPAVAVVIFCVAVSPLPLWAYLIAVYAAMAILRIRTFLEHQAHEKARGRTVIIEDRGPLAFLFLNNNLHVVHHIHPRVPWYGLPRLYRQNANRYLRQNEGYRYRSYAEIFRRYFLTAKDPVPHPHYEDWTAR